jgi:plastocyanin
MARLMGVLTVLVVATFLAVVAKAAAYKEIEVKDGGIISGKVLAGNAKAETQTFPITKDFVSCGTGTREVEFVRINGDALLDVVVYVENVEAGKPFLDDAKRILVEQKDCHFQPYLQAMANGAETKVINADVVWHSVRTYEVMKRARRGIYNVSQPQSFVGFTKAITLRRSHILKFECEVHTFMHAWVFVADNPYYAVADENGEFTISDLPPGKYVVKVLHERLGEREATVEVEAGGNAKVNFTY